MVSWTIRSFEDETPFEAKHRLKKAGLIKRYNSYMKKFRSRGLEPREAFRNTMEMNDMRVQYSKDIIAMKIERGEIDE